VAGPDCGYGDNAEFRHELAERGLAYVVQVSGDVAGLLRGNEVAGPLRRHEPDRRLGSFACRSTSATGCGRS
jgi:SRSO17 transposase